MNLCHQAKRNNFSQSTSKTKQRDVENTIIEKKNIIMLLKPFERTESIIEQPSI